MRVITSGTFTINVPPSFTCFSSVPLGKDCIGTHDGTFHCDEALACAMLKMLPTFAEWPIVRTRNSEELAKCKAVVDVGGVYDPTSLRFDHHQRTFGGVLESDGFQTKLSSAGLVYKHFGKEILRELVAGVMPEDVVDTILYPKVYKNFMEHIDAIDNGISVCDSSAGPRYHISTHLSSRVGNLNPRWNEEQTGDGGADANRRFLQAVALTGAELSEYVGGLAGGWWPARDAVAKALRRRKDDHPSGQIVVLDIYCPWKSHLLDLEADEKVSPPLLYVLYPDSGGKWRVQAVPESEDSFVSRLPLPAAWRGLRDEELSAVTGIDGGVFVHSGGFIGGCATREGALAMAAAAVALGAGEKVNGAAGAVSK